MSSIQSIFRNMFYEEILLLHCLCIPHVSSIRTVKEYQFRKENAYDPICLIEGWCINSPSAPWKKTNCVNHYSVQSTVKKQPKALNQEYLSSVIKCFSFFLFFLTPEPELNDLLDPKCMFYTSSCIATAEKKYRQFIRHSYHMGFCYLPLKRNNWYIQFTSRNWV